MKGEQLPNFVEHCLSSRPDRTTSAHGEISSPISHGLRLWLNPAFVCLLMEYPWWWMQPVPISFAPGAMASWRSRARQHLLNCLVGSGLIGGWMSNWAMPNAHDGKPGHDNTSTQHGNLKRDTEKWGLM
jgi:hypothetical protein